MSKRFVVQVIVALAVSVAGGWVAAGVARRRAGIQIIMKPEPDPCEPGE